MECCSSVPVCFLKNIETCHNGILNHSRTGMLPKAKEQGLIRVVFSEILRNIHLFYNWKQTS